jgi:ribosomal protein S18 acetylase RimI-like enzyme
MEITIRKAGIEDIDGIRNLYEKVSFIEGGLARKKDEITKDYIEYFVNKSIKSGVILLAIEENSSGIIGEIHCYGSGMKVFEHVLGELTIAVDPGYQGRKIGRMLFEKLLNIVKYEMPNINRIELIARESNLKAIQFYESLGFKIEGRFENRIKSVGGGYEADIPMAWLRGRN